MHVADALPSWRAINGLTITAQLGRILAFGGVFVAAAGSLGLMTLAQPQQVEFLEKKSRFIGWGFPCQSLDAFHTLRGEVSSSFKDARHIAYAYKILDSSQFYSRCYDAGEPAQTAGRPILVHVEANDLCNVAIFVIRYFGGIKLGKGGLARAYGNSAKMVIAAAATMPLRFYERQTVLLAFRDEALFLQQMTNWSAQLIEREYTAEGIRFTIDIPRENAHLLVPWLP